MTGHEHDIAGTVTVALLSAGIGLVNYMTKTEALQAVLVAAACGLIGGVMKGAGAHLWKRARLRWVKRRKG